MQLTTSDNAIKNGWQAIFGERFQEIEGKNAGSSTTDAVSGLNSIISPLAAIKAKLVPQLPSPPPLPTHFQLEDGTLTVYQNKQHRCLHFSEGAQLILPVEAMAACQTASPWALPSIDAIITPKFLQAGRLEDLTSVALAWLLRPKGLFMVHAFSVCRHPATLLIVGKSGSGKTTTGLNLVSNGWRYLSNDAAWLTHQEKQIIALPAPGGISFSDKTIELLPALTAWSHQFQESLDLGKYHAPVGAIPAKWWGVSSPIKALIFPEITAQSETTCQPMPRAVALAKIMGESIDRWDEPELKNHTLFLQDLCEQAQPFQLLLGQDVTKVPALLAEISS